MVRSSRTCLIPSKRAACPQSWQKSSRDYGRIQACRPPLREPRSTSWTIPLDSEYNSIQYIKSSVVPNNTIHSKNVWLIFQLSSENIFFRMLCFVGCKVGEWLKCACKLTFTATWVKWTESANQTTSPPSRTCWDLESRLLVSLRSSSPAKSSTLGVSSLDCNQTNKTLKILTKTEKYTDMLSMKSN